MHLEDVMGVWIKLEDREVVSLQWEKKVKSHVRGYYLENGHLKDVLAILIMIGCELRDITLPFRHGKDNVLGHYLA